MKRYRVHGTITASKYIGEFEAENKEQAEEMAWQEASVSVCYHCSKEVDGPEIDKLFVEEVTTNETRGH